jgi:hypothetical protein
MSTSSCWAHLTSELRDLLFLLRIDTEEAMDCDGDDDDEWFILSKNYYGNFLIPSRVLFIIQMDLLRHIR